MKNRKLRMNAAAIFAVLMLMGMASNAQQGRHNGDRPMCGGYGRGFERHTGQPFIYDQLYLTDEQKGKLDEIKLSSGKKMTQRQNKINELAAQLNTAITQDQANNNNVNNLIEEIGKLRTEDRKDQMADHLEIRELLTDKQKVIFDQRMSGRY